MIPSTWHFAIFALRWWRAPAAAWLFAMVVSPVFAQDKKGCEGVEFAGPPFTQYSREGLRKQLERNPKDVNALIHLGLYLEEDAQLRQAEDLYQRAILAKPDCYMGYLFAGLVRDRIGRKSSSDAEEDIRRALKLKPSLWNDANVQSFRMRHPDLMGKAPLIEKPAPTFNEELLSGTNWFTVGVGVGLLLAAPFVYLTRRRTSESKR